MIRFSNFLFSNFELNKSLFNYLCRQVEPWLVLSMLCKHHIRFLITCFFQRQLILDMYIYLFIFLLFLQKTMYQKGVKPHVNIVPFFLQENPSLFVVEMAKIQQVSVYHKFIIINYHFCYYNT